MSVPFGRLLGFLGTLQACDIRSKFCKQDNVAVGGCSHYATAPNRSALAGQFLGKADVA